MSDQLVGVIVGALIGFAGTALITLFQWCMEKKKRREQRLWHYRQDHIARIRPVWERLSGCLYGLLAVAQDAIKWLDRAASVQTPEESQRLIGEFDRRASETKEEAEKVTTELSKVPTEFWRILAIHDPELGENVRRQADEVLRSVGSVLRKVVSLEDIPLSADYIPRAKNELNECRYALIQSIRQVESAIERYVTRL